MSRLRLVFFACVSVLLAGFWPTDALAGSLAQEAQQQVQALLDQSQDTEKTFQAAMVARWEAFKSWLDLSADRQATAKLAVQELCRSLNDADTANRSNSLLMLAFLAGSQPEEVVASSYEAEIFSELVTAIECDDCPPYSAKENASYVLLVLANKLPISDLRVRFTQRVMDILVKEIQRGYSRCACNGMKILQKLGLRLPEDSLQVFFRPSVMAVLSLSWHHESQFGQDCISVAHILACRAPEFSQIFTPSILASLRKLLSRTTMDSVVAVGIDVLAVLICRLGSDFNQLALLTPEDVAFLQTAVQEGSPFVVYPLNALAIGFMYLPYERALAMLSAGFVDELSRRLETARTAARDGRDFLRTQEQGRAVAMFLYSLAARLAPVDLAKYFSTSVMGLLRSVIATSGADDDIRIKSSAIFAVLAKRLEKEPRLVTYFSLDDIKLFRDTFTWQEGDVVLNSICVLSDSITHLSATHVNELCTSGFLDGLCRGITAPCAYASRCAVILLVLAHQLEGELFLAAFSQSVVAALRMAAAGSGQIASIAQRALDILRQRHHPLVTA